MSDALGVLVLISYFLVGVVCAGLVKRFTHDDEMSLPFIPLWPVLGPVALMVVLYMWLGDDL